MAKKVGYSAPEKIDVSAWSESEACRTRVREICSSMLNEHDQLTTLSKRQFENGIFLEQFKKLTKQEIESNSNSKWMRRLSALGWVLLGAIATQFAACISFLRSVFSSN